MSETDSARGRTATSPREMPKAAWRDSLIRTWNESGSDNIGLISAFYGFLAFVPTLAALVLCYGLFADPAAIAGHLQSLFRLLPEEAARLIGEQLLSVVNTGNGKKGFGLVLSLALSIYGAMNGASAIVTAVNIAYDEDETRSFIRLTALACLMTVAGRDHRHFRDRCACFPRTSNAWCARDPHHGDTHRLLDIGRAGREHVAQHHLPLRSGS